MASKYLIELILRTKKEGTAGKEIQKELDGVGKVATTNVELVEKVKRLAGEFEREIATPDEARELLGLKGIESVNF